MKKCLKIILFLLNFIIITACNNKSETNSEIKTEAVYPPHVIYNEQYYQETGEKEKYNPKKHQLELLGKIKTTLNLREKATENFTSNSVPVGKEIYVLKNSDGTVIYTKSKKEDGIFYIFPYKLVK